jgi:stalled ribosome alternative rescue factor ArfA
MTRSREDLRIKGEKRRKGRGEEERRRRENKKEEEEYPASPDQPTLLY